MSRYLRRFNVTRISSSAILLLMIVVAGFTLRVYNLDWDQAAYLHPDELHVANTITARIVVDWPPDIDNLLDPESSRLNPRSDLVDSGKPANFAYGAMPLIVTDLAASTLSKITGDDWNEFYGRIYKVGRLLSALADTMTIFFVFLIGRRLMSSQAGLAGAALYATAPIPIQLAHFFTTDAWMTAFVTLCLYCAVRAAEDGSIRWFAATGAAFGFAMACKGSAGMLIVALGFAIILDVIRRHREGDSPGYAAAAAPERIAAAVASMVLAFAIFEPYALVRPAVYLAQLEEQSRIVRGQIDVPFTRQYVGTTPVLYQIEQLLRWGLGPAAGIACLCGGAMLAWRAIGKRQPGAILITAWLGAQCLVIALPEIKFLRYLAPVLPVLAVGGGIVVLSGLMWLRARIGQRPAYAAAGAFSLAVLFWTASFMSVYAGTNPRLAASEWIYANIPAGSRLSSETWDLALPVTLGPGLSVDDRQFQFVSMDLYGDRSPAVVSDQLYGYLTSTDYVVLASNRVSSAMPQSPWRYPVQIRYYQLLESGELGFTRVADFHRYPGIGPIRFNDQSADESFINYDHPRVLIYKKTSLVDRSVYNALMASAVTSPWSPVRHPISQSLLLDDPVGSLPVVADARWSAAVTDRTLPALLVWIALLAVLQQIGGPIAARLFPRFPDAGAGLARLVATLFAGYLVWILASLHVVSFRAIWCWAALLLVAALSFVLRRGSKPLHTPSERRSAKFGAAVAFWGVFALFLLYRFLNPDSWHPVWGGEKPMEFAHLNAILRSAHFPPYDPWFAGGYINYYYYGTYLVAYWIKLTGIPSEIAFNLAQPTIMAFLASTAYSVAAAISRDVTGSRRWPALGGGLGALLLVLIGNMDSVLRFARTAGDGLQIDFYGWVWAASRSIRGAITEFPYFTGLYADLHAHVIAWPITVLIIGLSYSIAQQPRLAAIALSRSRSSRSASWDIVARLLVLSIALGTLFATNAWDVAAYGALVAVSVFLATSTFRSLPLRLVVTAVATGGTALFAFAFFQPFFQHYVALFGSLGETRTRTDIGEFLTHFGGFLALLGFGIVTLALERGLRWRSLALADPAIIAAFIAGLGAVAALALSSPTWIVAIAIVTIALVLGGAIANMSAFSRQQLEGKLGGLVGGVGIGLTILLVVADRAVLALALAFAAAGASIWLCAHGNSARFTGALIAAGASIIAGAEIVFLVDDLEPDPVWYRMNTIFKFYNQVWTLFAIASAVLLTLMVQRFAASMLDRPLGIANKPFVDRGRPEDHEIHANSEPPIVDQMHEDEPEESAPEVDLRRIVAFRWAQAGTVVGVLVILAGLVNPVLTTASRFDLRFEGHPGPWTLDGLDWMRYGTLDRPEGEGKITFDSDLAAIEWFNENVDGSPVIAEASIGAYRGNGSRFSIATGLPTILGWERHERQQRYSEGLSERWGEVLTLYDSSDPAVKREIIDKYDVQYIVVGDVERYSFIGTTRFASEAGIAAFESMIGSDLEIAFQFGTTVVYRVLPASTAVTSTEAAD